MCMDPHALIPYRTLRHPVKRKRYHFAGPQSPRRLKNGLALER